MAFVSTRRVDFPMVDLAKIVYYPRFWDLAHRFYEESWEFSCGMHYNEILSEHQIAFPLVHSEAQFLHPIAYGDTVHCSITVAKIGTKSQGNDNTSADPEILIAIGDLAGSTDTTGLRAPTVTNMRFIWGTSATTDGSAGDSSQRILVDVTCHVRRLAVAIRCDSLLVGEGGGGEIGRAHV